MQSPITLPSSMLSAANSVVLVVVGHGSTTSLFHRQSWLSTIQGLNLAFLVDAQDQSLVGRIEIKADHIIELFDKTFVTTELESFGLLGFEAVSLPDTLDCHWQSEGGENTSGIVSFSQTDRLG